MAVTTIHKWVHPWDVLLPGRKRPVPVFVEIEYRDGRLSLSGVEGPTAKGNAAGSCGQLLPREGEPWGDRWHVATWSGRLIEVWRRWHLNDMRAGCAHQRAEGWDRRPIDPSKPTTAYGRHFPGQRQDSWNLLCWVDRAEHPEGLLSVPCPTCHYKYGSAWLREDVPEDVLTFLEGIPATDRCPWSLKVPAVGHFACRVREEGS
jgi:hypothetical protein